MPGAFGVRWFYPTLPYLLFGLYKFELFFLSTDHVVFRLFFIFLFLFLYLCCHLPPVTRSIIVTFGEYLPQASTKPHRCIFALCVLYIRRFPT